MDKEKRIKELIEKLNFYTKYYDEGHPQITDKKWDILYFELQKLENETGIYFEDSPTQKISYQVVNKLNKVKHNHPMLSLDKTKSIDAIKSFLENKDFICMAKMDGLTCSLRYVNGKLVSAETRGNGEEGEDILHNALVVKNIPNKINYTDELIVDGEIICTYDDFKPFENEYKNPRNFASGSIRLLNSSECAKRNLSFIAWDIINTSGQSCLSDKLMAAQNLGFTTVPYICNTDIKESVNYIKINSYNYPIDGLVFKYNNCKEYELAGRTDHHYRGGLAYKFYDEEYETTLQDIEFTMGRTGKLTPVAIFDTIDISGTDVSRANIHNLSIMKEILGNPYKGQKIWIIKSNEIIPQITRAEEDNELTKAYIDIPHVCPICGEPTKIIKENDSEVLYCANSQCQGKLINHIDHFFGKKGLDAKGLSKATIEKLINWGWVNNISDVFRLDAHQTDWQKKEGFGVKSVNNIITSIRESCNTNLDAIISAAGIPLIGRTVSKQIANEFTTYENFREAIRTGYDFASLDGFGYELNKSLKNYNYDELDYIVKNYLKINNKINENKEQKLKGLVFCITGKITKWKNRDELKLYIENLGGKCVGAVSANVNYLINNDIESTSAKNKKAKELNIEIINEETFLKKFDL